MSYAGNPSLARETKDRIVTTYNQTLDLAGQGRGQEAALGCDFILKMDPLFTPARQLQARLDGASGAVDVSDLEKLPLPSAEGAPAADEAPAAPPSTAETVHLSPEEVAAATGAPTPAPSSPSSGDSVPLEAVMATPTAVPVAVVSEPEPIPLESIAPQPPVAEPVAAEPIPVVSTPEDGGEGDRIGELLTEGQGLFEGGDFQGAIDAWSRIFLIDIDHQEAAERIELARKLKDEQERKLDETLFEANSLRDAGDLAGAREAYGRVLKIQPSHPAANEAIRRIDSGEALPGGGAPLADMAPEGEGGYGVDGGMELPETDLYDPGAVPGSRGAPDGPATVPGFGSPQVKKKSRTFPMIAAGVALVLGVGGSLLWINKDSLFPNSDPPVEADQDGQGLPQVNPIQKAATLFDQGEQEMAIARLEEIEEGNAFYDRAQQQLAVWRDQGPDEEAAPDTSEVDEERLARRESLIEMARQNYSEREYLRAAKAFRSADKIAALDGAVADLYQDSIRQILPIRQQIDFYNQREWDLLLPVLWKLHTQDPENRDVKRLLGDTYFNLAVRELQRGSLDDAHSNIEEVVALYSDDTMAERVFEFTSAYQVQPRDLLFKIFVKQLRYRR